MRTKMYVHRPDLQKVITDLEAKETFLNHSQLWEAIAKTTWAKNHKPDPITPAIARSRTLEMKLTIKTVAGRKGGSLSAEHKAAMQAGRGKRRPRSEKMKDFKEHFDLQRQHTPVRFHPLIEQAEAGSLRAKLKLVCLNCSGWQTREVAKCCIPWCPLFPERPYQGQGDQKEIPL